LIAIFNHKPAYKSIPVIGCLKSGKVVPILNAAKTQSEAGQEDKAATREEKAVKTQLKVSSEMVPGISALKPSPFGRGSNQ